MSCRHVKWTKREIDMLGKYPDPDVAKRLNRSVRSIQRIRRELGIARFSRLKMTPTHQALLGTMKDEVLAKKLGLSVFTIKDWRRHLKIPPFAAKKRRWTERELTMLGKYDDSEVARRLNRDLETVRRKRIALAPNGVQGRWTQVEMGLLLKHTPLEVAELTGRSLNSVLAKRKELNSNPLYRHLQLQFIRTKKK